MTTALSELEASPPHEDPPILAHQFEEQQGKLDREMMYLINKIKTHVPPKPKPSSNATTNATDNGTATETDGVSGGVCVGRCAGLTLGPSSECIL